MRKILFHGNKSRCDDGSILWFTVFLLFCVVSTIGLMLSASYAEYRNVRAEYETFVASQNVSGDSPQEISIK